MNKILTIILLCLSICIVSCGDDETLDAASFYVVSTDIDFSAAGGEGRIVVASPSAITATSNHQDWCAVRVEQQTVVVSLQPSVEMSNRTALVTITCGGESLVVPVVQGGAVVIMDEYDLNHAISYEGGTISLPFKTTASYEVEIPADVQEWLTYTIDDVNDLLLFNIERNSSKTPRGTSVTVKSGIKTVVYNISQIELSEEDLAGTYRCAFESGAGTWMEGTAELIPYPSMEHAFLVTGFSDFPTLVILEDNKLIMEGGINVGKYANVYDIYTAILTADGSVSFNGRCEAVPQYLDGKLSFQFSNSKVESMGDANVVGFAFWAFQGNSSMGWLELFYDFALSQVE